MLAQDQTKNLMIDINKTSGVTRPIITASSKSGIMRQTPLCNKGSAYNKNKFNIFLTKKRGGGVFPPRNIEIGLARAGGPRPYGILYIDQICKKLQNFLTLGISARPG